MRSRYAMLTVDVEALPRRAESDHVRRLMWGEHGAGSAGVREMCAVGEEFGARHVFFVDACGAYRYRDEVKEVIRWLHEAGQDVQLHAHPEYLPEGYWADTGFTYRPRFMNQYDQAKTEHILRRFGRLISDITGEPVRAFRAGSFRWNADTLRALKAVGIPMSFNNSVKAALDGVSPYAEPTNSPFVWSNGIIEVPVAERLSVPWIERLGWERLSYPYSNDYFVAPWRRLSPFGLGIENDFLVLLFHSWSLLHWNEAGQAEYRDDRRIEDYRRLVRRLSKDYDIITTRELRELIEQGRITLSRAVDIALTTLRIPDRTGKIRLQ